MNCARFAVIAVLMAGCRDRGGFVPTGSTPLPPAARTAPDVHDSFLDRQMSLRVDQHAQNLTPVAPMMRGSLTEGGIASHSFEMSPGHCYRILAVGGVEVNDLDLALFAPDGSEVDSDTASDNYPVIGRRRPVCPPAGGRYRLEVRMYDGQGDYGVQVFGTP